MNRFALIAIVIICMFGCATNTHLVEKLSQVKSENYIVLAEDASYEQSRGVGVMWREGLLKGIYRPELENEHGTFYRGPPGCVTQHMGPTAMGPFEGGVWVPRDRVNFSPRIYYYFNFNREKASTAGGLTLLAVLGASEGNITLMAQMGKGTFLDKVAVTNLPLR
jgi:hypothetical protein